MTRLTRRVPHRGDVISGYIALGLVVMLASGALSWILMALWLLYTLASKL